MTRVTIPSMSVASVAAAVSVAMMLLAPVTGARAALAQSSSDPAEYSRPGPATPEALARLVLERLTGGDMESFREVYPFEPGLKAQAAAWEVDLATASPLVLRRSEDRALILLGAWPELGNSGDETIVGRSFSGLYLASRDDDGWRLTQKVPVDAGNRILRQTLHVDLDPARGLDVTDTLRVELGGEHGFGVFLNRTAELRDVRLAGRPVESVFSGGYLWLDTPEDLKGLTDVVVSYHLPVATDTLGGANSGRFAEAHGHVRNQYFWHPFFDFGSERDRATFDVTVRAPERYRVVTSLPQRDTVRDGVRTTRGKSTQPIYALTLIYDTVEPSVVRLGEAGDVTAELFLPPDSDPSVDSVLAAIENAYEVLGEAFGLPDGATYLVIALTPLRGGGGWHFRSNHLIAGGARPGSIDRSGPFPRAWLGHEVAHGWTRPTGPATNFLSEGWANYAESLLIAARYGTTAEADYWESQRTYYERNDFDGNARLSYDPNNSGVSYYKGSWVLRMLRDHVGKPAFRRAMREYMAIPADEDAGLDAFTAAMSAASGRDVAGFLDPWIEGTEIPDLEARVEDGRVIVEQRQEVPFRLDLELDLLTDEGTVRRTLALGARSDTLATTELEPVRDVLLDPEHRLLIRRHRGEVVRFELDAPDAEDVALDASFVADGLPATRADDGTWTVEVPLTAGTYGYWWKVDGEYREPEGGERLVVEPVAVMDETARP